MKNGLYEDKYSNKRWYKDDLLHREDGPAIELSDGHKEWWVNGQRHRIDGPAIEWFDGDKTWYINGQLHRLDGPAVEFVNGKKYWFYQDKCAANCTSQKQFELWLRKEKLNSFW